MLGGFLRCLRWGCGGTCSCCQASLWGWVGSWLLNGGQPLNVCAQEFCFAVPTLKPGVSGGVPPSPTFCRKTPDCQEWKKCGCFLLIDFAVMLAFWKLFLFSSSGLSSGLFWIGMGIGLNFSVLGVFVPHFRLWLVFSRNLLSYEFLVKDSRLCTSIYSTKRQTIPNV